jgi:hypothetical protein
VWLGVNAEQKPLEEIATPLTAEDADSTPRPPAAQSAPPGRAGARSAGALPALVADAPVYAVALIDTVRDREVGEIAAALASTGTLERRQLARLVHAELWGPGRFSSALREAVVQCKVRRTGRPCKRSCPVRRVSVTTHRPLMTPSTATELGSGPEPDMIPIHPAAARRRRRR